MTPTLDLAVPCFSEEAVLPETARCLREKLSALRAAEKPRDTEEN